MSEQKIPTFGYRNGGAQIFHLRPGESLPKGWKDSPVAEEAPKKQSAPDGKH